MEDPIHIVTVIVIIKYRNRYLLVQRSKDDDIFPLNWQNLGGKVEVGERIEEAINREVKEESGIKLKKDINPIFIQSYSWNKSDKEIMRLGIIFMIKLKVKPKRIRLSKELDNFGWFTYNQALKLDTIGKEYKTGTIGQLKVAEILN